MRVFLLGLILVFCVQIQSESLAGDDLGLAHDADVYLVPMGDISHDEVGRLADYYQRLTGLRVQATGALPVLAEATNPERRQLIAERVLSFLSAVFAPWITNPHALVIAISGYDLYIETVDWRFAFAAGQDHVAVVSGARMGDGKSSVKAWSDLHLSRLRKMVGKRIAVQFFGVDGFSQEQFALFSQPILSVQDLDRLDETDLEQVLIALARQPVIRNLKTLRDPPKGDWVRVGEHPEMGGDGAQGGPEWGRVAAVLGVFFAVAGALIWIVIKQQRDLLQVWNNTARQLGWRFFDDRAAVQPSGSPRIEGVIDGTFFVVESDREGSGSNEQDEQVWTRIQATLATPYSLHITPITGWLRWIRLFGNRLRTGDRAYDCRFLIEQTGVAKGAVDLPLALRQLHLQNAIPVSIGNGRIQASIPGLTRDEVQLAQQIQVVAAWGEFLRQGTVATESIGQPDRIPSRQYGLCLVNHLALLAFWLGLAMTIMLFFWIKTEETNAPWFIAWRGLAPLGALAWFAWMVRIWPRIRRRPIQHVFSATLLPASVFFGIWMAAGVWVNAWNALGGPSKPTQIVGLVMDKTMTRGKGGPTYRVTVHDVGEQRAVEIYVTENFYKQIGYGDPASFEARKGRLGIYYWFAW